MTQNEMSSISLFKYISFLGQSLNFSKLHRHFIRSEQKRFPWNETSFFNKIFQKRNKQRFLLIFFWNISCFKNIKLYMYEILEVCLIPRSMSLKRHENFWFKNLSCEGLSYFPNDFWKAVNHQESSNYVAVTTTLLNHSSTANKVVFRVCISSLQRLVHSRLFFCQDCNFKSKHERRRRENLRAI